MTAQQQREDSEWARDPFLDWIEENMVVTARVPVPGWRLRVADGIDAIADLMLAAVLRITAWLRGR